jgi:hypothetical protein
LEPEGGESGGIDSELQSLAKEFAASGALSELVRVFTRSAHQQPPGPDVQPAAESVGQPAGATTPSYAGQDSSSTDKVAKEAATSNHESAPAVADDLIPDDYLGEPLI